jgi:hypothetical protein
LILLVFNFGLMQNEKISNMEGYNLRPLIYCYLMENKVNNI